MVKSDRRFFTIAAAVLGLGLAANVGIWSNIFFQWYLEGFKTPTVDQPINTYDSAKKEIAEDPIKLSETIMRDYVSGTEFGAAVTAFQHLGISTDIEDFINAATYSDEDFIYNFRGNVKQENGVIYPPGLTETINRFAVEYTIPYWAINQTSQSWDAIKDIVASNTPVIAYYTSTNSYPEFTNETQNDYQLYANHRAVCITLIKDGFVYYTDPIEGDKKESENWFKMCWEACGNMAVSIEKR